MNLRTAAKTTGCLLVAPVETILILPMAAGELGLAIWLIVKGGKV